MELCHIGKQIFIQPAKKLFAFYGIRWSVTLSSIIAKFELTCSEPIPQPYITHTHARARTRTRVRIFPYF